MKAAPTWRREAQGGRTMMLISLVISVSAGFSSKSGDYLLCGVLKVRAAGSICVCTMAK